MIIVKIYLGLSLVLLWTVQGQFIFRQFLDLAYTSQDLQAPPMQSVLTIGFQSIVPVTSRAVSSVCFGFFCLLVSSVSNFHPDTRGRWWTLFQALWFSRAVWREEHCKQITLACVGSVCSVSATLGLPPFMVCVLSQSTLLRLQVALAGTVRSWPWVVCTSQV